MKIVEMQGTIFSHFTLHFNFLTFLRAQERRMLQNIEFLLQECQALACKNDRRVHQSARKKPPSRRFEKLNKNSAQSIKFRPGELASFLADRPGNEIERCTELLKSDAHKFSKELNSNGEGSL